MKTNLLNDLSNVVKKGTGLACSWSQVGRMSGEGAIEHPLSTHSAPFGTRWKPAGEKGSTRVWKYVAMILCVFVLSVANVGTVWGATEDIDVKTKGNTSTTAYTGSSLTSMSSISFTATGGSASIAAASGSYTQFTTGTTTGVRITFTPKSGVTVNALEFTLSSGNNKGSFTYSSTNAVITNDNKTHTLSGLSLSSAFDIYCHLVSGSSSQSIKVTNIKVTYSASTSRKFKSGEKVFFKDASGNITWGSLNALWKVSTGNIYAYFWNDTENAWSTAATAVGGAVNAASTVYSITVPGSGKEYTKVLFTRGTAATFESGFWNETTDQYPAEGKNMFCISNDGDYDGSRNPTHKWIGTWSTYANGPAIVGSMNNWRPDGGEFNFSGSIGTVYIELEAETSYKFKVLEGTTWYGNGGTISNSIPSDWWGFVNNGDECTLTTAEAGTYAFKWDNDNKKLGVWYPRGRLAKNKYLYFDGRNESNWDDAAYHAKYLFKRYDSDDQVGDLLYSETPLEDWVYYQTTPNNDYVGQVQIMRMDPSNHATQWNYANIIAAHSRTSELQNCLVAPSSGWSDITLTWGTYCPPMTKPTLTDNNGSTIYAGNGTSGNPYIVGVSTSISVSASASTTLEDPDMTAMYDFKAGGTSQQDTEGTTYTFTASSSDNTSYTLTVDAYNTYNSTNSTKKTSDALYYKARTLYTITYNKGSYGTGDNVTEKKAKAVDITLRGVTFTRTGYTQTGWNKNSSGSGGTHYDLSASYTSNSDLTIYPEWTAKTTSVTLNPNTANHGTGSNVVATATFDGTSLTGFTAATPADGYALEGYYTAATSGTKILNANGSFVKNTTYTTNDGTPKWKSELSSLELFAHYVPKYTVTYKKNGGASGADGSVTGTTTDASSPYASGTEVTTIANSYSNSGYKFKWWNKNYGGDGEDFYIGEKFTISANTNLYAQWEEVASGWAYWCGDAISASPATYTDITGNGVTMRIGGVRGTAFDYNTGIQDATVVSKYSSTEKHANVIAVNAKNSKYVTISFTDGSAINSLKLGVCNKGGTKEMLVIYSTTADFSSGAGEKVAHNTSKYDQTSKNVIDFSPAVSNKYLYARIYMQVDEAVYGQTGGSNNTIRIYSIKAQAGSSCSAPTSPSISGTTSYTYGGTISLTATCATGTDASTTYTWYKGSDWATASASSPVQAASTSGATFSKTAAMSDAGTYWCEAANSTCKSHNSSGYAITVAKASISPSLSYSSTTLTTGDNSSSPTVTGNSGSGSVSYAVTSSSPSGCITVNGSTGVVTAVAAGTGTVTATIAATDNYLGGTATADFTVTDPCFYANDLKKKKDGGDIAKDAEITASMLASGTITGGTLQNTSGAKLSHNEGYGLVMESGKQVTLTLTSPKIFEAGTVITVKSYSSNQGASDKTDYNKYSGIIVGTHKLADSVKCTSNTPALFTQTYTVTTSDGIEGGNSVVFKRTTAKTYIYSIKVTGCGERSGYTVTYDDNGSTSGSVPVDEDSPYDEDATVTVLGNTGSLAKNGYTFAGWNSKADGTGADFVAAGTFTITKDTVLYAKWTPNTYDITYNLNGASWAGGYSAPANYTVGTGATLPISSNMTNTGYTFGGWYDNSGLTGSSVTAISTSDYGNKEFWAKWTENTYTITYKKNGDGAGNDGDVTGSTSSTNGHYVTVADNGFALENHVFAGWNTAANGSGESYSEGEEIELTDDMTLYAIWADDYNVTWGNVQIGGAGDAVTPNLGGKNYTITATISSWDGDTEDIELGDVTEGVIASITGTTASTVTVTFAVGASVDGDEISLSLNIPAHGDYGAKVATTDAIEIEICSGGTIVWDFTTTDFKNGGTWSTSGGAENKAYATDEETILRYYAGGSSDEWDSSNKQLKTQGTTSFSTGTSKKQMTQKYFQFPTLSGSATISVTYGTTGDDLKIYEATSTDIYGIDPIITITTSSTTSSSYTFSSEKTYYMTMESKKSYFKNITVTYAGGGSSVTPTLTWSPLVSSDAAWDDDNDRLSKRKSDADFTFTATQDKNSLGAITYASSNTSVVTVNATTGKVHVEGAGDATITATLAESGCYNKATATYAIHVVDDCDDEAGTISTEDLGCDGIRMTVTGHTAAEGVSYQWYKVKAEGSDDEVGEDQDNYTATAAGEYYVIVTNTGDRHCAKTSTNTVVIAAKAAVTASKIVDSWYVKNGRRTPDIALVQTTNTTDFTVAFKGSTSIWDPTNSVSTGFGGCPFRLGADGIIYLDGQSAAGEAPTGMTVGDTTITITAKGCGAGNELSVDIKLHVQAATDRKSVAFVVDGTEKGRFDQPNADHSTNSALYQFLDYTLSGGSGHFDLTAQNIYSSVDEKEIREHFSQFDGIIITDDPNTGKKKDGKSYVNAFGTMIDVRPILTMEAFVSKLANWKAKGINGNPESPNPRQYAMTLQCKDHEIFFGIDPTSPNVAHEEIDGVDYWTVTMVDKNKSPYAGKSDTEDTDGTPALQGFSASDVSGLLLLGEIMNGDKIMYTGVERQKEPAARLMLLGIQNKALPNALTTEGKTIIENAVEYLLKTNMEEVDDCSNYFIGGGGDNSWETDANWFKGKAPNSPMIRARILAPCEVSSTVHAAHIDIVTSGTSSKKSGEMTGKLTINPTGALIVGGEVRTAKAPYFNKNDLMPTDTNNLVINTNSTNQAALIFNNDAADTKATVNLYSLGRKEGGVYQFQYFAVPMEYVDVNPAFAGSGIYTYVWHEASGWERRGYYTGLEAFEGVGITTKFDEASHNYTMKGTLASTADKEIALTAETNGQNIVGNSWTAPIQISKLEEDNGSLSNKTVYIYNTGNDETADDGYGTKAGQWIAIPFEAAEFGEWDGLKVIPAMQSFTIMVDGASTLTLDYDKVVRGASTDMNAKLRAPKREASHEGIDLIRIRVADSQTHTDLYLFEGESFSEEFDNGWEAKYMSCDGRSAKLYAETTIGQMAVVAQPEYEGTVLGFAPGKETEYTFTFSGPNKEYYLNDLKEKKSTLISEDESYMFTFEEGDTNRFYISKTPINAPSVATGTENTGDGVKARKVLVNDKLYIILNGRVYSAEGVMVK